MTTMDAETQPLPIAIERQARVQLQVEAAEGAGLKSAPALRRSRAGRGDGVEPSLEVPLPRGSGKGFEITLIHPGEANGFTFTRDVLRASAALWENCQVMIDHAAWGRSVRDLGGALQNVRWSDEHDGLTAELIPGGPSQEIICEAARLMLESGPKPDLGFSADVLFTADSSGRVERIVQPLSCDLVMDPAFATKFIRMLNSRGGEMTKPNEPARAAEPEGGAEEALAAERALRQERIATGNRLLEAVLDNSQLPPPAQADVRRRFHGRDFKAVELTSAVKSWKEALAESHAGDEIAGPSRVSAMFNDVDQVQAAVDDLLGAPREPGAERLKVHKFQGIRDAYLFMTGDYDFHGGYYRDRVQFQHTTASFPGLVVNALNKSLAEHWKQLGAAGYDWWQKIATVEHFEGLQQISWLIFGTVGSLPEVSEGAEYTELKLGDNRETSDWTKYGGYLGITLEAMLRDDTRKLRAAPRELALAGMRNISEQVAALFTDNAGIGPTLADGGALFNNTAVTTAGGHANLLTTALGSDYTAWNAAAQAVYNQPMLIANETGYYGAGKKMGIMPSICLVPMALKAQAEALFIPRWASQVEVLAAAGGPTFGGHVLPVTVPEWTDTTDWAAVVDPRLVPGVMLGEIFGLMPQIFIAGNEQDPAMFANDESRIKVRHFLAVGVADFRPLHKSNV